MVGAKANGKIVPNTYKLLNGDIIEILTSPQAKGPSHDWLKIVKTSQARTKINQWLKREKRDENIIHGREMFETWYKMTSMLESGLDISGIITHHYHYTEFEQGFAAMRSGKSGKVILNWED